MGTGRGSSSGGRRGSRLVGALALLAAVACNRTALIPGLYQRSAAGSGGESSHAGPGSGGSNGGGAGLSTGGGLASGPQTTNSPAGGQGTSGGQVGEGSQGGQGSQVGQGASSGGDAAMEPSACGCGPHQVCLESTGYCVCADGTFGADCLFCDPTTGAFEWPEGSGICETDPCVRLSCQEPGQCLAVDGKVGCVCEDGWSGPECDRKYVPYRIPPFADDVVFDSKGNGWFRTTQGLLYWDFGATPEDTADDAFRLYDDQSRGELAIDSADRTWQVQGNTLSRVDHRGTPLDPTDDESTVVSASVGAFDGFAQVDIDEEDRPWAVAAQRSGAFVLLNPGSLDGAEPQWLVLFEDEQILELAPEQNGVWLATSDGLFYVDWGAAIDDPADDSWVDYSDVVELDGQMIKDIDIDGAGAKWFTTDQQILVLSDPDGPLQRAGDVWSVWTPPASVQALGDGPLMALGPDDARWLRTASDAVLRVAAAPQEAPAVTPYAPKMCPEFEGQLGEAALDLEPTPEGRLLVASSGHLYLLDFAGTPFDRSDDTWSRVPASPFGGWSTTIALHPSGGYWVHQYGPVVGQVGCNRALYHVDWGAARNLWDDRWTPIALPGPCTRLEGVDARGRLWVSASPTSAETLIGVLDSAVPPASVTQEDWTVYSEAELPAVALGSVLLGDPASLWLGGTRFDTGTTLSDKSDDRLVQLDPFTPQAVSVDAVGARWFADESLPAHLRRLDDAGTPWTPEDDVWLAFRPPPELSEHRFDFLKVDPSGRKWLLRQTNYSSGRELLSFDDGGTLGDPSDDVWTLYGSDDALPKLTTVFVIDGSSNLWLGSDEGMGYLHVER